MDLAEIEDLKFRTPLDELETQAIVPARARSVARCRGAATLVAGVGTAAIVMCMGMALIAAIAPASATALMLLILGVSLVTTLAGMGAGARYVIPPERKLLDLQLEPEAKRFTGEHWEERRRLLEETVSFNDALGVFKRLSENAGESVVDEAVVANLVLRRERLQSDIDAYLAAFDRASADERARIARAEAKRGKPKTEDKRLLAEFKDKAVRLAVLEEKLDALPETADAGSTVDVSLYVAAARFRDALEQERAALVAKGLKPKRLPERRVAPKLLTATT